MKNMFVRIKSAAFLGLHCYPVDVEVNISKGLPVHSIVGLPDTAIKESKDRVKSAILNCGFEFPQGYCIVNLAPADTKKEGSIYDLAIALGILTASHQIPVECLIDIAAIGELSLDGNLRHVDGVLPMCILLKSIGIKKVLVPTENASEAALVKGVEVIPVDNLKNSVLYLLGKQKIEPHYVDIEKMFVEKDNTALDFSDVKGQYQAKRALEIAAAGGHNVLMVGPPGSGKTMLARRLPSIMPDLTLEEALEITKIYSIAGLLEKGKSLIKTRPFRAPHHTTSDIGIIGGGRIPKPGEITLSHHGLLFLDEFPEFARNVIEALRQPLEDGKVTISRASAALTYPAQFMLVAAMNPCPCGNFGDTSCICTCAPWKVQKYLSKISTPILDRIDIHISVPRLKREDLTSAVVGETSESIKKRVVAARAIQNKRYEKYNILNNAKIPPKYMSKFCVMTEDAENFLKEAIYKLRLSARSFDKILKVARTIADLENCEIIQGCHIAEAIQYRQERR